VIHTARAIDELVLMAPLLDHPTIFDLRLHFTGKFDTLRACATCTIPLPTPVPLPRKPLPLPDASGFGPRLPDLISDQCSVASEKKKDELPRSSSLQQYVSRDDGPKVSGRRLMGIHGKWESLVVWVGTWLASFWTLVRCFNFQLALAQCDAFTAPRDVHGIAV
jgi:hypothetical protein